MDLVLTKKEAHVILEAYHNLFPEIRLNWHAGIRRELNLKRKLTAPSGWERYFYGRFGEDMFKEAYAWRPQHTIPWILNRLMFHLVAERKAERLPQFRLIYQCHDSLTLTARNEDLEKIAKVCIETKPWQNGISLSGGTLIIPTEVKIGRCLAQLKEWHGS
jgi:DNA polymerase I-like protein with 3'-5' exonuclease and polymerase domains